MNTTNLFVELIVIGVGAAAAIVLTIFAVFGVEWVPTTKLASVAVIAPGASIVYLLGIVTDRIADRAFSPVASSIRKSVFPDQEAYNAARSKVYEESPFLNLFEYTRSRLRIVRGWTLNTLLIAPAFNAFVLVQLSQELPSVKIAIVGDVVLAAILIGCAFSWWALYEAQVGAIKSHQLFLPDRD